MLRISFPEMLMRWARHAAPVAAVACIVGLVILSWLPKEMESRTSLPGQVEHVVAYLGTALIACLAWQGLKPRLIIGLLIALAALLELGQHWVPGRTAQLVDAAASAVGVLLGVAAAILITPRSTSARKRRAF